MPVWDQISGALSLSLMMLFAQNVLFAGSYGLSRLLPILDDTAESFRFCGAVTGYATLSALFGGAVTALFPDTVQGQIFLGLSCAVFLAVLCSLAVTVAGIAGKRRLVPALIAGALNSAVLIVPLACRHLLLGPLESMILGFFSGVGFTLAAVLLQLGFSAISENYVPRTFRGLPVKLLYAAILSMVFVGFSGQMFRV